MRNPHRLTVFTLLTLAASLAAPALAADEPGPALAEAIQLDAPAPDCAAASEAPVTLDDEAGLPAPIRLDHGTPGPGDDCYREYTDDEGCFCPRAYGTSWGTKYYSRLVCPTAGYVGPWGVDSLVCYNSPC